MANKLDKLLQVAHKFRAWQGLPEGVCYSEYLNDYRNELLDKLTKESDTARFYRIQGMLEVLDNLITLRGEVDNYIKNVSSGKMKEIKKENTNGMGRQEVRST
jgi:hypothetical protein